MDTNDEESVSRQDDGKVSGSDKKKFSPTKVQKYMIAAGTIIVIAVSVILYTMPEAKKPVVHKAQIKVAETSKPEPQKIMTSTNRDTLKAATPAPDASFANANAAKIAQRFLPAVEAQPTFKVVPQHSAVKAKNRRVLTRYMMKKLNSRPAAKGIMSSTPSMASLPVMMTIPQKTIVPVPNRSAKDETEDSGQKRTAENIKLFMAKGWIPYYMRDNEHLLYRNAADGGSTVPKMINTAWFLDADTVVLFAHALNCPEKNMDTFAYMELDAQTLKVTNSSSRDIAEQGLQFKSIQDASDQKLYDIVCK